MQACHFIFRHATIYFRFQNPQVVFRLKVMNQIGTSITVKHEYKHLCVCQTAWDHIRKNVRAHSKKSFLVDRNKTFFCSTQTFHQASYSINEGVRGKSRMKDRSTDGQGHEDRDTGHFLHLFPTRSEKKRGKKTPRKSHCWTWWTRRTHSLQRSTVRYVLCVNKTAHELLVFPVPQTRVCK